jgi:poly [ADP-ribose] polymerase 2/3/4
VIDEGCALPGAKVYKSYSCVLSQTNIAKNSNKFYIMQLLTTNDVDFWLYTRYGRIGDKGVTSKVLYTQVHLAIKRFCSVFYSKTGNKWGATPFQSKSGKYVLMNIEEPEVVTTSDVPEELITLSKQVDDLIKMISDKQLMTKTLQKLNVDVKKLPLGKIKKEQLAEAEKILKTLGMYLSSGILEQLSAFGHTDPKNFKDQRVIELSSSFWTLLPYSCGRNRPPIIGSTKILGECADQLDGVRSIEISTKIIERSTTPGKIYETLDTTITSIDQASSEWDMLQTYVSSSQGATHDKTTLLEAFSIDKHFKDQAKIFTTTSNHTLLFHGSRSANYVGIFSEGLRIPNISQVANGSVLGPGIYFADCVTKSFNYCYDTTGLVLVCEVALGTSEKISRASGHPLPMAFQSRMALGKYAPSGDGMKRWDRDLTVSIPSGKLEPSGVPNSGFHYNEYVIFRKEQYRFRYLLKLKIDRGT